MSKKNKRSSRNTTVKQNGGPAAVQSMQAASSSPRSSEKGFTPDYSDVIKDLRRIGTLAGTFFVIMVILSFFLK
ncbi:MAG: hypothetical protein Kow0088_07250 [Anaerolineales bacterium]